MGKVLFTSATNTKVTVAATSTAVLTAKTAREFARITNDSDSVIYLALGAAAVMNQGIRLAVGGHFEINSTNLYTGTINAICSAGSKVLSVTNG